MEKNMTVSGDTECWVCRRKAKEVLDTVLDFLMSGDEPFETEGYAVCMKTVNLRRGFPVHVCLICYELLWLTFAESLKEELEIEDIGEIVTLRDLDEARIVICSE